jgi:FtsH-binding integral membrane protein
VSQRLGLRAIWRWTALEIVPTFAGVAAMAAIIWLISRHFDLWLYAQLAIFLVIFSAAFSLRRRLRTRRSPVRESGQN